MPRKVLIVNSIEQEAKTVERLCNKVGFDDVIFAESVEDGFRKAQSEKPHVIVTETMLLDGSGFELCRKIRGIALESKVILVTDKVNALDAVNAAKAGANDYCSKAGKLMLLSESLRKIEQTEAVDIHDEVGQFTWAAVKVNEGIRLLYDELYNMREELQKVDRLKFDFILTVSHELRTPMTIIREGVSQVLEGILGDITEGQRDFLSMALSEIDRLSKILNEILDISKLEDGRFNIIRGTLNIVDLAKEVIATFTSEAEDKGLQLRTHFSPENIDIYADRNAIKQVLSHLISNAIKFTEKGYIEITVRESAEYVECSVYDSGRGIAENNIRNVFGKFRQFDRIVGPGAKGTGLGLSICKGIICMHNGDIWVESEQDKETRFTFTLPKYTAEKLSKEYVAENVKKAMEQGSPLSIINFDNKNLDAIEKKLGKERVTSIITGLESLIKNILRRESDTVIKKDPSAMVVLHGTEKDNTMQVIGRVQEFFGDYLSKERLDKDIEITFRI